MAKKEAATVDIRATIDVSRMSVSWQFADGEALYIYADQISTDIANQALLHGLKQKIGDAAAIARNPETGRSATLADKRNAMAEVLARLKDGQWNKPREEGAGAGATSLLVEALRRLAPGKTLESIKVYLEGQSDVQKKALAASSRVKPVIDAIRAERAKVDGDAVEEAESDLDGFLGD